MCGIHAQITASRDDKTSPELDRYLQNRGPDHRGTFQARIDLPHGPLYLTLTSTVLSLRGDHVVKQPLVDPDTGSVLCWNGEAWRINGEAVEGNDAEAVLSLLAAGSHNDRRDEVLEALRAVEGPFAFIYFDKPTGRLYYGRDRLGRRSLLVQSGESVSLCSVTDSAVPRWDEVEADGCYELCLDESFKSQGKSIIRHEWDEDTTKVRLHKLDVVTPHSATYHVRCRASVSSTWNPSEARLRPLQWIKTQCQYNNCEATCSTHFNHGCLACQHHLEPVFRMLASQYSFLAA